MSSARFCRCSLEALDSKYSVSRSLADRMLTSFAFSSFSDLISARWLLFCVFSQGKARILPPVPIQRMFVCVEKGLPGCTEVEV